MRKVSDKTSAKTGRAPAWITAYPHITTVSAGTITSSPGPTPKAISAWCKVEVPEFEVIANFIPNLFANATS